MTKPTNAPACFAAASIFTHDSDICRGCCAFQECSVASLETLQAIRGIVKVDDLLKRHARAKKIARDVIQADDERKAAELPPGSSQPGLPQAVERKTQVATVELGLSADEERIIVTLSSSNSKKLAVALCKTGAMQRIKAGVQERVVALGEKSPSYLRHALTLLIARGFTKSELSKSFMNELGWKEESARSHVSFLYPVLLQFGIGQEVDGRLVAAPATA